MKVLKIAAIAIVGTFVLIQFVPYGRDHANPPVTAEPAWDTRQTRELAVVACFDCHSNETQWPWYTSVAPLSWLTQRDVDEGRDALNFSEWDRAQSKLDDIGKVVLEGEMPPWTYTVIHSGAKLSDAEKRALADGLAATIAASPPIVENGSGASGEG